MQQANTIGEWLIDCSSHIDVFEDQDGPWCIASTTSITKLLDLYQIRDAVPARRDLILYAIAINLDMLLGRDTSDRESIENDRDTLLAFAMNNWPDLLRIDREMGLGGDFDTHVVPIVSHLLNGNSPQTP